MNTNNITITINGKQIKTTAGENLLNAALENGIEIPHLCFDSRMEAYGGCGLCVVEVEGVPKLVRACSAKASDGMVVRTDTERTARTRKMALSMLASDHRGDCKAPCSLGCPAKTDVQGYVGLVANGQYAEALALIKNNIPIPASIGRVCPHPCESECRRRFVEEPISIACIKTFAADRDLEQETPYLPETKEPTGKRVAVIGAGPAGLSAAYFLRLLGHDATIYEAMPEAGGMLRYGIPEYRLPKAVLDKEISLIEQMGVTIRRGSRVGRDISLQQLRDTYDAVFAAIGSWKSSAMRVPGEETPGVMGGIDFLIDLSQGIFPETGSDVIVVGGGNTAMDVARSCVRLGARVRVVYRRDEASMPAERLEIEEAKEEGVFFSFLNAPVRVLSDNGRVSGLECEIMSLGEPDASGRRSPVPTGEKVVYAATSVIAAIGQQLNLGNLELPVDEKRRTIRLAGSKYKTGMAGVFTGGDCATGPQIAIDAIAAGREAAQEIHAYLNGGELNYKERPLILQTDFDRSALDKTAREARVPLRVMDKDVRKSTFAPMTYTMTPQEAIREASRCLECGCKDYFECQLIRYIQQYEIDTEKDYGAKPRKQTLEGNNFLVQDQGKCIACGLCVRVCREVVGKEVLGLVRRGFDTLVAPGLTLPLNEAGCISCGACVDICPTGAWMERKSAHKEIPLALEKITSVCSFCSAGCLIDYHVKGGIIYKTSHSPLSDNPLCVGGKFAYESIHSPRRVLRATAAGNEIGIPAALGEISEKLKQCRSIAIVVSPSVTNQLLDKIRAYAETIGAKLFVDNSKKGDAVKPKNDVDPALQKINPACNSYGARQRGYADRIEGEFDALLAFGNVALGAEFRRRQKLTVSFPLTEDFVLTPSDYVIPFASLCESEGSVTSYNGKTRRAVRVIPPLSGYDNEALIDLLQK